VPGNIHNPQFLSFWKNTLNASEKILSILQHGYPLQFDSTPPRYFERNNATVRNNLPEVRKLILEMKYLGVIAFTDVQPHCVNPLGLVIKESDGEKKVRLIFDASRCLNKHLDPKQVKLMHLERALQLTQHNDYQAVFDLQQAYYHVAIRADDWKFLGAFIEMDYGNQFFYYKHLPFGLNVAVHAITKIWKPLVCHIQALGIPFSIYIDDGRVLGSKKSIEHHREVVYNVLENAGWQLSREKSDSKGQAAQVKQYLGFIIDTTIMKCFCPESKLSKIEYIVSTILSRDSCDVRDVSKLAGKISSTFISHGMLARVCLRSTYVAIESHVAVHGWTGSLCLPPQAKLELQEYLSVCRERNGHGIESQYTDVRIDAFMSNPLCRNPVVNGLQTPFNAMIFSDASNWKAAVTFFDGQKSIEACFTFTESEK